MIDAIGNIDLSLAHRHQIIENKRLQSIRKNTTLSISFVVIFLPLSLSWCLRVCVCVCSLSRNADFYIFIFIAMIFKWTNLIALLEMQLHGKFQFKLCKIVFHTMFRSIVHTITCQFCMYSFFYWFIHPF